MIWLIGFYFVLFCILCFAIFECAKLLAIGFVFVHLWLLFHCSLYTWPIFLFDI